jgi:hypothetical protein
VFLDGLLIVFYVVCSESLLFVGVFCLGSSYGFIELLTCDLMLVGFANCVVLSIVCLCVGTLVLITFIGIDFVLYMLMVLFGCCMLFVMICLLEFNCIGFNCGSLGVLIVLFVCGLHFSHVVVGVKLLGFLNPQSMVFGWYFYISILFLQFIFMLRCPFVCFVYQCFGLVSAIIFIIRYVVFMVVSVCLLMFCVLSIWISGYHFMFVVCFYTLCLPCLCLTTNNKET